MSLSNSMHITPHPPMRWISTKYPTDPAVHADSLALLFCDFVVSGRIVTLHSVILNHLVIERGAGVVSDSSETVRRAVLFDQSQPQQNGSSRSGE